MGAEQGQPSEQHAFATTDEDIAWGFAHTAHQIEYSKHRFGHRDMPDRSRVYTVHPHPEMEMGVHHPRHPLHRPESGDIEEYVAPEFKVKGRIDIQPGHQGTFPTINWMQFAHPDISGDPNHPTPKEVAEGMQLMSGSPGGKRQARERAAVQEPNRNRVTANQMDLFSGRTVAEHAVGLDPRIVVDHGDAALRNYHMQRMYR